MSSSPTYRPQKQIDQASWLVRRVAPEGAGARRLASLALFGILVVGILIGLLYLTWASDALTLKAGQIADRTIKAPRTATFVSQTRTDEQRQEAYDDARNVVLTTDQSVEPNQLAALRQSLSAIATVRQSQLVSLSGTPTLSPSRPADTSQAVDRVRASVDGLTASQAETILNLSDSSWSRVKDESQRLLQAAFSDQISPENVASVKEHLADRVSLLLSRNERSSSLALAQPFVRANQQIDDAKTKAAREAAAAAVQPVQVTVQQGQVIVRDGDPVTKDIVEKLEYFHLLAPTETWQQFAGVAGLLAVLTLAFILYLYRVPTGLWQGRQLLLIGIVVVVPVVAGRFFISHTDLRYMFPTAAAVMLLAILLDFQVAVVAGGVISLYLGIINGASYEVAFVTFIACLAGAALIWRAERTLTFVWAGGAVALATAASALLFGLMDRDLSAMQAGNLLLDGAINGVLSASITFLSFSLFGRLFGITTHLQLLELAHPNQPLLYRLAREAPGTYHHSIVVSNLAESAVEAVGGDPLFARVAVLYHDVGKVLRPSFFVENQANRANVHDALDPHTSARIILEHVTDGVRLARKARLPRPIIDVIQQHHGTTLIRYFYMQAVNSGEAVDEGEFRYPGPKPQTKESGIIMLADGVEAAVRSASQSGRLYETSSNGNGSVSSQSGKLGEIVDGVIRERLEDGQLDECDLTLRQIEQIRQTFIAILEGIYHPRIEYPELRKVDGQAVAPVEAAGQRPAEAAAESSS